MPDVHKNYGVSLVLDFGTWWRHVKTIYSLLRSLCLGSSRNVSGGGGNVAWRAQTTAAKKT